MDPSPVASNNQFATTRWTLVVAAGAKLEGDQSPAQEALAELCQMYWPALYSYLRRQGHPPDKAEDLVQGFFAQLMERSALAAADPNRGRFRSFLIASLRYFVANRYDFETAKKRGGAARRLSLDLVTAEQSYHASLIDHATADRMFDRQWALDVLNCTLRRLRAQYESKGKTSLFAQLSQFLNVDGESPSMAEAARALDMTIQATKMAASRMRQQYRLTLREVIADTVASPAQIDDEIRELFDALASV